MRRSRGVALAVGVGFMVLLATYVAYVSWKTPVPPGTINGIEPIAGFSVVSGFNAASDGRISIRILNYSVVQAGSIDWENDTGYPVPENDTLVITVDLNVTNVGSGNATIPPVFAYWKNITSGEIYENGNFIHNATIKGSTAIAYPLYSSGSAEPPLSPGKTKLIRFFFAYTYPAYIQPSLDRAKATLKLLGVAYLEREYGGNIDRDRGISCTSSSAPCLQPNVELIATA